MVAKNKNAFSNIALSAVKTGNNSPADFKDVDKDSLDEQIKERYKQDTRYRSYLAIWVMWIVPVWLVLVFILVLLCAFDVCELSNGVLSVLLATTTANVLGLAHIVLKGIYK